MNMVSKCVNVDPFLFFFADSILLLNCKSSIHNVTGLILCIMRQFVL